MSINDPHLITITKNPNAQLPKGEPVANPELPELVQVCDPRVLLCVEPVDFESVVAGDFIRAGQWTKPRLVEHVDAQHDGPVLHLAEHDTTRTNDHGIRRVDCTEWLSRSGWVRFPHLTALWSAAHGTP